MIAHSGLSQLLQVLALVVCVARVVGLAFERLWRQPQVIGEIVAGILLGPSMLGAVAPGFQQFLLPPSVVPELGLLANIGVLLFMFLIGLELDLRTLAAKTGAAVVISHASIAVPLLLGGLLSFWLPSAYAPPGVKFSNFALFVGLSMSVTAFPVLGRILASRNMQAMATGRLALACAAVDDATAWCLLALVSGMARARLGQAALTFVLTLAYGWGMLRFAQPLVARLVARWQQPGSVGSSALVSVLCGIFLSSSLTELIGIHAMFGAFVWGLILPARGYLAETLRTWLEHLVQCLFLPLFFVSTGLHTQFDLLVSWGDWGVCAAVIATATVGKFGGSYLGARYSGIPHLEAFAIGALMNTRGLIGLIVLDVGFQLGLLSQKLFATLLIMALATTLLAAPLLDYVLRRAKNRCKDGAAFGALA